MYNKKSKKSDKYVRRKKQKNKNGNKVIQNKN